MPIDPRFQRIARRLTTLELVGESGGTESPEAEAFGLRVDDHGARAGHRFLGFYSREGVCRALEAYGVRAELEKLGLGNYEVIISSRDPYRHRAQVLLDGVVDDEHRLIDLIIHQRRVRERELTEGRSVGESFDMLLVEWLCLQNPRASFSRERPQLPGQRHPGLGLGYTFHNLTMLMAQRTRCDGVLNVPEHLHLAVIYGRIGYRFVCERHMDEVDRVSRKMWRLHLAAAAWAAERGLIRVVEADNDEGSATPWSYTPTEMVAPVSRRLSERLGGGDGFLKRLVRPRSHLRVEIDVDALRQSLRDDPVVGLDPDDILRGPG